MTRVTGTLVKFAIFGIVMAFAQAKSEREIFLILATIPTAFLVIRGAEFLRKSKEK